MIYKLNGELFDIRQEHRIGDVNYPYNWFQDADNRAAMGIIEEADPVVVRPLADVKTDKINQINAEAQRIILTKYPLWVQANCANGIYPVTFKDVMKTDISNIINAVNLLKDNINNSKDELTVNNILISLPTI